MQTALCAVIIALFLMLKEYAGSRKEMVKEMADLIDRAALGIGKANPLVFDKVEYAHGWNRAVEIIQNASAVDAVQVVRCKDCKYYNQFLILRECTKDYSLCNVSPDDYCSRGERKTDG